MDQAVDPPEPPRAVMAELTYLVDTGEKPVNVPSTGGGGVSRWQGRHEAHTVTIRNGRALDEGFDLDRQGFALVRQKTAVGDFYDDAQIEALYEAEVEALVKKVTGARRVVVFDHTRRSDSPAEREAKGIREPAGNVHNDYTPRSAPQRVRDLLPAREAEALLERRFAIVNVWRPIKGPVRSAPLALCDAQSVAPEDLIAAERRAKDRIGEIQQAVYNPAHRWYYFPDMAPEEALLIKVYDSAEDGRARFTPHTAFDDPTSPPDAPPRESIESRTFAFF